MSHAPTATLLFEGAPFPQPSHQGPIMEAERVNTIRSQLVDLTTRVVELRRYL